MARETSLSKVCWTSVNDIPQVQDVIGRFKLDDRISCTERERFSWGYLTAQTGELDGRR